MSIHEAVKFANIAATPAPFSLSQGGYYVENIIATFGGGNVQLQQLAADNATYVNVGAAVSAAGVQVRQLSPGQYKYVITTATAVYIELVRAPAM